MAASQDHITVATPMGACLVAGGTTFAVWAPGATSVHVALDPTTDYQPTADDELVLDASAGRWTGYFAGVSAGAHYRFYVVGAGSSGFKRDPWARELADSYPDSDCIVVDPDAYPWHDAGFQPPVPADLIVYQFHVGTYYARDASGQDLRAERAARFLDALDRVEYLADLGVTAVQPLPVVEFQGEWSLGYNGTDLFSPERDYTVAGGAQLAQYHDRVNVLLGAKGQPPLQLTDLDGQTAQLKAFVDVCHVYGLAVIFDVVYNHAGGGLDDQSIDHFDRPANPNETNSIYFSTSDLAGGRVFAFSTPQVQDFLIGNAEMFLAEYHADGLRFDEVTVIDNSGGRAFCQRMTTELHHRHPAAILIAEYWRTERWLAIGPTPGGMGFDVGYSDWVRNAVRDTVQSTEAGAAAVVDVDELLRGLQRPAKLAHAWQAYNCVENHDLVLDMDGDHRYPRIPRLADPSDSRSWYARSRSRVATGLLLTAPGVPMLFMGQEFLEDKLWRDDFHLPQNLIWWDGLDGADRSMADFRTFIRDLVALRRGNTALRADAIITYPPDDTNRVAVFYRWSDDGHSHVVVVASFDEMTLSAYSIGMPLPGRWIEACNSDYYDHFPNPFVQGNGGEVTADGPPRHGMAQSALLTVPANSILIFTTP
jgi:1,4-alpha-glucan branching enzyme